LLGTKGYVVVVVVVVVLEEIDSVNHLQNLGIGYELINIRTITTCHCVSA
jgi:hypothetical protein